MVSPRKGSELSLTFQCCACVQGEQEHDPVITCSAVLGRRRTALFAWQAWQSLTIAGTLQASRYPLMR